MPSKRASTEARIRRAMANAELQLERDFREERADAAAHFHNAIMEVINEHRPTIETQMYVFKMIEWELMQLRHEQNFGPASHVHANGHSESDHGGNAIGIGIG